jgi:hypothetical protein
MDALSSSVFWYLGPLLVVYQVKCLILDGWNCCTNFVTMQFTNSEQRLFCPEVPTTKRSSFWIVFIIMVVGHSSFKLTFTFMLQSVFLLPNVSEWGNMSIRGLLFQWASTMKIPTLKCFGLVQSGPHHHLIDN